MSCSPTKLVTVISTREHHLAPSFFSCFSSALMFSRTRGSLSKSAAFHCRLLILQRFSFLWGRVKQFPQVGHCTKHFLTIIMSSTAWIELSYCSVRSRNVLERDLFFQDLEGNKHWMYMYVWFKQIFIMKKAIH